MRRQWLLSVSFLTVFGAVAHAQTDPTLAQGLIPYQSYQGGDIDNVNLFNGALHVQIPLIQYPQRGQALKLGFSEVYNGKGFSLEYVCSGAGSTQHCFDEWVNVGIGANSTESYNEVDDFQLVDDQQVRLALYNYNFTYNNMAQHRAIARWVSSDGAVHHGALFGSNQQISLDGTSFSVPMDDQGNCPNSNCSTQDTHGVTYFPFANPAQPELREDSNGNIISMQYPSGAGSGSAPSAYDDTTGRIIPLGTTTTDYAGCTGTLPTSSAGLWQIPGANGSTLTYKFCYAQVQICIAGQTQSCGESPVYTGPLGYATTMTRLQSIVLPNKQTWTFAYSTKQPGDPTTVNYGDLSQIIFPTGGTIPISTNF